MMGTCYTHPLTGFYQNYVIIIHIIYNWTEELIFIVHWSIDLETVMTIKKILVQL